MVAIVENPIIPESFAGGRRRSRPLIRMVTCIVRREKLDGVTDALNKLNLVGGMTVADVGGLGAEHAESGMFRGTKFTPAFVGRVKVELVIEAGDVGEVEKIVTEIARTGEIGDGKIFVLRVWEVMRIRTGERGASAL